MLACLSAEQFREWQAFYLLEPFGDDWRRTGRLAAITAAPHLKRAAKYDESKFMPVPKRQRRQSPAEIRSVFAQLFKQQTGKAPPPDKAQS